MTKNVMALPQTVGFKAEAVDEEGVWCACTVEEVDNDNVIISFDGGNAEWNRRVCDPCIKMYSVRLFTLCYKDKMELCSKSREMVQDIEIKKTSK